MDWKSRPRVMGILNVTPDSFSDGGAHLSKDSAIAYALELYEQGADIIDIGGESTRPGAIPVSTETELERVLPVVRELKETTDLVISVDTMKAEVAEACIKAGADIINDVNGLRGEGMMETVCQHDVDTVIMFMYGSPSTFATDTLKGDVIGTIGKFLKERTEMAMDMGLSKNRIILDPGVGFGSDHDQSFEIIKNCGRICGDFPCLIGASRKRFLSHIFPGMERDVASAEAARIAALSGADIIRTHNVPLTKEYLSRRSEQ